jgi:AcrR family transcriptional regulator
MAVIRFKRRKRRPGDRAGMTRSKIALAAATQIEKGGEGAFSMRRLAKALGVAPTTISAHFKGGLSDIEDEVVRAILANVAPPFRPLQEPGEYVEEMFLSALRALEGRPTLSMLTILRLTHNPLVVPALAERSLASLMALGVAPARVGEAYRAILQTLFALILGGPARAYQAPEADRIPSLLASLTLQASEYPNVMEFGQDILRDQVEAASWSPEPDAVRNAIGRLREALAQLEDVAPAGALTVEE